MAPPAIGRSPWSLSVPPAIECAGVLLAYRWWCALFVCLYVGITIYGVLVARGKVEPSLGLIEMVVSHNDRASRDRLIAEKRNVAVAVAAFTAFISVLYGVAAWVPRKPWAWIFGLPVLASTIIPFGISAAGAAPLLAYWAKLNGKRNFGLPG